VPDFIVNWIEVTAFPRQQIWRDECMAIGVTQFLRMVSLQTLQTNIAVYDTQYTGLGESLMPRYLAFRIVGLWQAEVRTHFGLSVLHVYSVMYRVLPLSSLVFTLLHKNSASNLHEPYPLKCASYNCSKRQVFNLLSRSVLNHQFTLV